MKRKYQAIIIAVIAILLTAYNLYSRDFRFKILETPELSRYNEDRVSYQHIQKGVDDLVDNSIATLLIARDSKLYLFKDGFDNKNDVLRTRHILDLEQQLIPDLWVNKIDNKPDFIQVTDRRLEIMRNITQDFVTANFGDFYFKVRDAFLKKHVEIFRSLIINRRDSGLRAERTMIPKKIWDTGETKYKTTASARTIDEKIYYAEDADGDNITETFTISIADGFQWGAYSGANILFILNNQQKEITDIIGQLTKEAFNGTSEEENLLKQNFPKAELITDMINDIYQVDKEAEARLAELRKN